MALSQSPDNSDDALPEVQTFQAVHARPKTPCQNPHAQTAKLHLFLRLRCRGPRRSGLKSSLNARKRSMCIGLCRSLPTPSVKTVPSFALSLPTACCNPPDRKPCPTCAGRVLGFQRYPAVPRLPRAAFQPQKGCLLQFTAHAAASICHLCHWQCRASEQLMTVKFTRTACLLVQELCPDRNMKRIGRLANSPYYIYIYTLVSSNNRLYIAKHSQRKGSLGWRPTSYLSKRGGSRRSLAFAPCTFHSTVPPYSHVIVRSIGSSGRDIQRAPSLKSGALALKHRLLIPQETRNIRGMRSYSNFGI